MRGPLQDEAGMTTDHEQHALGAGVEFRALAAAAGRDFHQVLGESFGKAGERAGQDPGAGVVPERQHAGDDVAHHAFRDDRIGFGEYGPAGHQRGLGRQSTAGRVIGRGGHGLVSNNSCDSFEPLTSRAQRGSCQGGPGLACSDLGAPDVVPELTPWQGGYRAPPPCRWRPLRSGRDGPEPDRYRPPRRR